MNYYQCINFIDEDQEYTHVDKKARIDYLQQGNNNASNSGKIYPCVN